MLEYYAPAQIVTTVISGSVDIYVGFHEEKHKAFLVSSNPDSIIISGDKLFTDRNYFVFIESTSPMS